MSRFRTSPIRRWKRRKDARLKFLDRGQAMEKIHDLTCLSDILPTGFHGAVNAGVEPGATVYVAGTGRSAWRGLRRAICWEHPARLLAI